MTEQLQLDGVGPVVRSRVIVVNTETGFEGRPKLLDSPAGCVTCAMNRCVPSLHELVYQHQGLLYCQNHRPRRT